MADEDHLERLRQGVDAWNDWRVKDFSGRPDLNKADLCGMELSGVNLVDADLDEADLRGTNLIEARLDGANLFRANLRRAKLIEAYLREADLSEASLREANLSEANLNKADLRGADLYKASVGGANLVEADLRGANLSVADLIDAWLDHADLTGAKLWETQRAGWSIKDVICQRAFWDRDAEESIEYGPGEFERIFAERPRIVLRYPGGMSSVDLLALPLIVERLQAEHPGSVLHVRSVQNDAGGASVTITVEDLTGRSGEAFGQALVRLQTKLECIVEERDHLRQRLGAIFQEGISKAAEFLALPRQEIHVHRPSGLTAIEGPTMSRDTYNISGQAGAVGPGAHAHDNTFRQMQGGIDLLKLAEELARLRDAMKGETTGTREQDKAIGVVADAEEAATKGDGPAALQHLKSAGKWTLGIAEKIGVAVATEALKKAM